MARIVVSSVGSLGDLHPFIALARGLRARGHEVTFAVERGFVERLRAEGFETAPLASDISALPAPLARQLVTGSDPFAALRVIARDYQGPSLAANIRLLRETCAGADLLIASAGQIAASAVAELTGVRWVTVALSPTIPSAYVPPSPELARLRGPLARLANGAAWRLGALAVACASDGPLNAGRAAVGLPPRKRLLQDGNLSPLLTAVAWSPACFPRPADWPAHVAVTGFLLWDEPEGWREPEALTAFLDDKTGGPVVAVSSGSMGGDVGDAFAPFFRATIAAIHAAGARALVIGAGAGAPWASADGDSATLSVDYAPFSRVYPRCTAVIHHGGAGTLAQSLRAGVPTLVAPWGADQFFHGALIERLGVGRVVTRRQYTIQARDALVALLTQARYRERARTLAERIADEDGVARLCERVEWALTQSSATRTITTPAG
ncbi:MAG TPA: glycosyltransferase [Ktedonobacterales bacterium]|nr:glycosyltransferase [Ktedonobacterales bacterium]